MHDEPPLKLVQLAIGEMAAAYMQHSCKHRHLQPLVQEQLFNLAD